MLRSKSLGTVLSQFSRFGCVNRMGPVQCFSTPAATAPSSTIAPSHSEPVKSTTPESGSPQSAPESIIVASTVAVVDESAASSTVAGGPTATPSSSLAFAAAAGSTSESEWDDLTDIPPEVREQAVNVAWQALWGGTALAVGTFAVGIYGVHLYLDVDNITEFREKMQELMPQVVERWKPSIEGPLNSVRTTMEPMAANVKDSIRPEEDSWIQTRMLKMQKLVMTLRGDPGLSELNSVSSLESGTESPKNEE